MTSYDVFLTMSAGPCVKAVFSPFLAMYAASKSLYGRAVHVEGIKPMLKAPMVSALEATI
jgi:hypothetical protein